MWSLILLDCQISVTAGSHTQIYISLPPCLCITPPPIILPSPLFSAKSCVDLCISVCVCVCVCVAGLTAPVHYTVSDQLMCHYTVRRPLLSLRRVSLSAARFVGDTETSKVKHTLSPRARLAAPSAPPHTPTHTPPPPPSPTSRSCSLQTQTEYSISILKVFIYSFFPFIVIILKIAVEVNLATPAVTMVTASGV